jgi:hypothetical protein
MIRFSISDLLDPQECYDYLLRVLHPNGLQCKAGHPLSADQAPHDRSIISIIRGKPLAVARRHPVDAVRLAG